MGQESLKQQIKVDQYLKNKELAHVLFSGFLWLACWFPFNNNQVDTTMPPATYGGCWVCPMASQQCRGLQPPCVAELGDPGGAVQWPVRQENTSQHTYVIPGINYCSYKNI